MPRKPKQDEGTVHSEAEAVIAAATNGIDEALLNRLVKEVEDKRLEIKARMREASDECQPLRDEIAAIIKEAAENGMPKRSFGCILKERKHLYEAAHASDSLNDHAKAAYDEMKVKLQKLADELGPLGEAARAAHAAAAPA